MKRREPSEPVNSRPLADKRSTGVTYSIKEDDDYSFSDRIVLYKPSSYSDHILRGAPSDWFRIAPELLVDFEVSDDTGIVVRTIDEYMNKPSELKQLSEKLKQRTSKAYSLCVLLIVMTNTNISSSIIDDLSVNCVFSFFTVILCDSFSEAGYYISALKSYDKRGGEIIQKHVKSDIISQASNVLSSINGINKDNVTTLTTRYKTMSDIMTANLSDLSELSGMGNKRILNLYRAFQQGDE